MSGGGRGKEEVYMLNFPGLGEENCFEHMRFGI